jgi:uncharacterized membrane protein YgcG
LQNRCAKQDEETDLQRPNALRAGLERVIDRVGRIMAVRDEQPVKKALDAGRMGVPSRAMDVSVIMVAVIAVLVLVLGVLVLVVAMLSVVIVVVIVVIMKLGVFVRLAHAISSS